MAGATVALLLLLWSLAVPSMSGAHPPGWRPDEATAVATLRITADAQLAFRDGLSADRDGDGVGEFGWFTALAGHEPPLLSAAFREVEDGCVRRGGYLFQLWLPTVAGAWIREGSRHAVDADGAEARFCLYAWPSQESRGQRAFFIDAAGVLYAADNVGRRYCDAEREVPVDAALPSSAAYAEAPAEGRLGRDGSVWRVIN